MKNDNRNHIYDKNKKKYDNDDSWWIIVIGILDILVSIVIGFLVMYALFVGGASV